jgi:hypothetical protein
METPQMRFVSYKEYLLHLGLQAVLSLGLLLMGLTFFAGIAFVDLVVDGFVLGGAIWTGTLSCTEGLCLLLATSLCFFLSTLGWEHLRLVYERQHPVRLWRRSTTEQIPVAESLLRASYDSDFRQEAVLLRAATPYQETPPDQLLRAATQAESDFFHAEEGG